MNLNLENTGEKKTFLGKPWENRGKPKENLGKNQRTTRGKHGDDLGYTVNLQKPEPNLAILKFVP